MKFTLGLAAALLALAPALACSSASRASAVPALTAASLEPLVDGHFAIINDGDPARRLERMPAVYTDAIVFHDPGPPVAGYEAISTAYERLHQRYPGALFRRDPTILERDGMIRVGWTLGRPGEAPLHHGEDVMRIDDGRIGAVWVFIQPEPATAPVFAGIEHAGVTVPDLAAATRFFHDVMGCEPATSMGAFKTDDDWMKVHLGVDPRAEIAGIAMLRCGHGSNIELLQYTDRTRREAPIGNSDNGAAHLAFYTADMKAAVAHLEKHGIRTMGEPFTKTSGDTAGETFVYFRAPWGLQLELVSAPGGKAYEKNARGPLLWSPLAPAQ